LYLNLWLIVVRRSERLSLVVKDGASPSGWVLLGIDLQEGNWTRCVEINLNHQSLIQYVRAAVSSDLLESMAGIEHTDAWLFESQRRIEEKNFRDPDDVYFLQPWNHGECHATGDRRSGV
jgi:hypothetical protein